MDKKTEIAVFGGGCFWCTEAVFRELRGVIAVMPGYAGGPSIPRSSGRDGGPEGLATSSGQAPTYDEVCSGKTGHAEVIRIEYKPVEIKFSDLLTVFFATHDPTTPNRQGNDVGTQYRSVILYTSKGQKKQAEEFIKKLNESTPEGKDIVTEVKPLDKFYEAEEHHREFYKKNPSEAYCQIVINRKLEKLQKEFAELLKNKSK